MFQSNRIIALDIGASKIVLAEFLAGRTGAPELINYAIGSLGVDQESESDASAYIVSTIRDLMRDNNIKPAPLLMTISGQSVFPRYVKLPPVTRDKVLQIIQYEAVQNVPFSIDEVVWDYQLIEGAGAEELNVMLVAVKIENITSLTDCVQAAGLEPDIVDAAPMALYNVVRYNYPGLEGCAMVLDIGARSSNLIFIEETRIFSRSIPVAGNAITQELMKEFEVPFQEAEDMKKAHAFVAFGGVYAGPESEVADRISKIVRNVVTRLHAEVNRSINFYRSQQGGSPPSLILLTGGSSVIPHTDTFFREKLKVEVDYLNPFINVAVNQRLDAERAGENLHLLGEVTGLALRRCLSCPVEMNLMPPDLVAKKVFRKRLPFFGLAAAALILTMLCWWVYSHRMSTVRESQLRIVNERIEGLRGIYKNLSAVRKSKSLARAKIDEVVDVIILRSHWIRWMDAIRSCMLDGMWLTAMKPVADKKGITHIEIEGQGFADRLKLAATAEKTAIAIFRDRLKEQSCFSPDTKIIRIPPISPEAYAREFTILIRLHEPLKVK